MTAPVRSVRVWVRLGLRGGVFNSGYGSVAFVSKDRAEANWVGPVARATLVLDPPKPKKRRAKR